MIWKYNFWQTLFLSSKSFSPIAEKVILQRLPLSPSKWNGIIDIKFCFWVKNHMNMKICNSFIIFLLLDCIFILHLISKTGWGEKILGLLLFSLLNPPKRIGIHTQIHINDKKRKLLFDWYTIQALKRSCLGLEKHNYKSMKHG